MYCRGPRHAGLPVPHAGLPSTLANLMVRSITRSLVFVALTWSGGCCSRFALSSSRDTQHTYALHCMCGLPKPMDQSLCVVNAHLSLSAGTPRRLQSHEAAAVVAQGRQGMVAAHRCCGLPFRPLLLAFHVYPDRRKACLSHRISRTHMSSQASAWQVQTHHKVHSRHLAAEHLASLLRPSLRRACFPPAGQGKAAPKQGGACRKGSSSDG